jgi:HAD superfamily hydrolase (TIGR01549 family)
VSRAVFFDLWNTIVYCPTRKRVEEIVKLVGLNVGYEELMSGVRARTFTDSSIKFSDYLREYLSERSLECGDGILDEVEVIWRGRLDDTRLFPETEDVLMDLSRDYQLGLISNLDVSGAEYFRKRYDNLAGCFETILFSCEVGLVKPDTRIFQLALDAVGVEAVDAWMVGDRMQDDIEGALNAGINPILVDRSGKVFKQEFPVVRSLKEVRGIIEGG